MGNRFYGLSNIPTQFRQEDVKTGTGTQATDVEVRIDDTKGWNRLMVVTALEEIILRINAGFDDLGTI